MDTYHKTKRIGQIFNFISYKKIRILYWQDKIDNYKECTFQEFYISTYNDLDKKYGFKYERSFDSIREAKLKKYCH